MKPFILKKFEIQQSEAVFRVGTDGFLLGVLVDLHEATQILEVGTGTGLITLMMAQRNTKVQILAVDMDAKAVTLARENFKNSNFSERIVCEEQDFCTFTASMKFDHVVCNPPYFLPSSSEKDKMARQRISLDFHSLIKNSKNVLTAFGKLTVVLPTVFCDEFMHTAKENGFFLTRQIHIFGLLGSSSKRMILEFSLVEKKCQVEDFVIEKSPRMYSDQYLEATKDFHVFQGKK